MTDNAADGRQRGLKPFAELAVWLSICALAYSQTGLFNREIPEYEFGAVSWPRAICIMIAVGAIGQFILQMSAPACSGRSAAGNGRGPARPDLAAIGKRTAIFAFPLIWLFLAPRLGFYLTAPFFVLGMLLLMRVRSPVYLAAVTAVIYSLVLLLFTRFFFVALPVGRIPAFYDINVAIIGFARAGI